MKKRRMIPVLLLRNGWIVQSREFSEYQNIGSAISSIRRLSEWASDELILLDITQEGRYDTGRDDQEYSNHSDFLEILDEVARVTFMPLVVGGRIRSLSDIDQRLSRGADKVAINTAAITSPRLIQDAARMYGSQCVTVSIDVMGTDRGYSVVYAGRRNVTSMSPIEWAKQVEELGAGEVLLNVVDRDGVGLGYDIDLIGSVADELNIPLIALGGVGEWAHMVDALTSTTVDAVAASNIFHHVDQSVYVAKRYLHAAGMNVRKPDLLAIG